MLGILLNSLISARKVTEDLTTLYNQGQNLFGTAVYSDPYEFITPEIGSSATYTIQDVVEGNANKGLSATNTFEFKDFTVPDRVTLKPVHYTRGRGGTKGPYSPLLLKCTGTLTVNGTITSAGTGGMTERYDGSATFNDNTIQSGIAYAWEQGPGWSTTTNNFYKLAAYGANGGFFDMKTAFYGAGGGGGHNYKRGRGHSRHKHVDHNYGFACGGGVWAGSNHCAGCAGGFVALYFRHLIIDGKEYGKDPGCDITRVSANGAAEANIIESGWWGGAGSIIIAADTIVIGPNGSINSNAIRYTGGSWRYSLLNNPPQMCRSSIYSIQSGYYIDSNGKLVYGTPPNNTYYYHTGYTDAEGNPELSSIEGNADYTSGGAGVVLGYKVND